MRARTISNGYVNITDITPANDPAKTRLPGGRCLKHINNKFTRKQASITNTKVFSRAIPVIPRVVVKGGCSALWTLVYSFSTVVHSGEPLSDIMLIVMAVFHH